MTRGETRARVLHWFVRGGGSEMARQSGMERHHVRAYLRKYGITRAE